MLSVEGRTVMISPHLGLVPLFHRGDRIRVQGHERSWRGKKFFMPTSRLHVVRLPALRVGLAEALGLPKDSRVSLTATASEVAPFTSRAGKHHLRFVVLEGSLRCPAIMYEGTFGAREQALLEGGGPLQMEARTAVYQGKPSLVVTGVER